MKVQKDWSVTLPLLYRGNLVSQLLAMLQNFTVEKIAEEGTLQVLAGNCFEHDVVFAIDFGEHTEGCTVLVIVAASEFWVTDAIKTGISDRVLTDLACLNEYTDGQNPLTEAPPDLIGKTYPRCPFTRFAKAAIIKAAQTCRKIYG